MNVLVTGGAGSGKSAHAEQLACSLSGSRIYLATMTDHGGEARARIARHRQQRDGLGFSTIECRGTLPTSLPPKGVVLLDDIGNLVANALFAPDGSMADPKLILERLQREIARLFEDCEHSVVVGNEVGADGRASDPATHAWIRLMGALCCSVAAQADAVIELVAGIPLVVKGAGAEGWTS